jgi:chemotaxis family two-component system sensor kinase Cph1
MNIPELTPCDKERVAFLGVIQDFSSVLVTDDHYRITHASKNASSFLGLPPDLLGKDLFELFSTTKEVFEQDLAQRHLVAQRDKKGSQHIWQFERHPETNPNLIYRRSRLAMDELQKTQTWEDLVTVAAKEIRQLTNYDRVMIYRFHQDFHGEVVAESLADGLEPFLGLHYPATDIPVPARKVFLENWVRMIPNVDYTPITVEPEGTELDLGNTLARGVSPIHIEYLHNMGVQATLTISIKSQGKLWGLIACHHKQPKFMDLYWRNALEDVGRTLSGMLRDVATIEEHQQRVRLQSIHKALFSRVQNSTDLAEDLTKYSPNLIDLVSSNGAAAALYLDGRWVTIGNSPSQQHLDQIVDWLVENHSDEPVYSTNELPKSFPSAANFKEFSTGLMAVSIPKTKKTYILFFRPEYVQSVRWAGKPQAYEPESDGKIHPRKSFEEWRSSVVDEAEPWKSWEIEAAQQLRTAILALDLRKQFEKEQEARADAERAMRAREELMAVLSHDLKNPIGSILLSTKMIERSFKGDQSATSLTNLQRIERSAQNMNNLINDILHVTKLESGNLSMEKNPVDLTQLIEEVVDMLSPLARENQQKLFINPKSLHCAVRCDKERVIQVLSNLIGNAIKFTPPGGAIEVHITECGPEYSKIAVKDQGPGIPAENRKNVFDRFWQAKETNRLGTGLGLAISKGIVESHGGSIWVEENPPVGSIFYFTIPLH